MKEIKSDARKGGGFSNAAPSLDAGELEKPAADFCSLLPKCGHASTGIAGMLKRSPLVCLGCQHPVHLHLGKARNSLTDYGIG